MFTVKVKIDAWQEKNIFWMFTKNTLREKYMLFNTIARRKITRCDRWVWTKVDFASIIRDFDFDGKNVFFSRKKLDMKYIYCGHRAVARWKKKKRAKTDISEWNHFTHAKSKRKSNTNFMTMKSILLDSW